MFAFARQTAAAGLLALFASTATVASAADGSGSLLVVVRSDEGTALAAARVTLDRGRIDRTTDATGAVSLDRLAPGTYAISATAAGFTALNPQLIAVQSGVRTEVDLRLTRSTTSLVTIGSISTNGTASVSSATQAAQSLRTQEYAARGFTRISDVLGDALSTTVIRQGSGSAAAPRSVALRGPDPTETLVDIDGHELNNGISGDFDLSLLDPADFENVQVVYGIAPGALLGPSTIGGAINVRTLEPTRTPRGLMRVQYGSFKQSTATLQATGTQDRLGYAVSLHQANGANDVSRELVTDAQGRSALVGSDVDAQTALAKIRYTFGGRAGATAEFSVRDQAVVRDLSAALTARVEDAYVPSIGSRLLGHNAGYGLDVSLPFEVDRASGVARSLLVFRHLTSFATQSVDGAVSGSTPAYFNDRDVIGTDSLEIDRTLSHGTFALKVRVRSENLATFDPTLAGAVTEQSLERRASANHRATADSVRATTVGLAQQQRSVVARYTFDASRSLHATIASYYSDFSGFGRSLDPRLGLVYTPNAATAIRASAGTAFQAPQLTALFVPDDLPPPDANGHIAIGNPSLKADHATEYDLGFDRLLGGGLRPIRLSGDFYRTNLRTPSQRLLPIATCPADAPSLACASYPINIGNAVYTGMELRAERAIGTHSTLRAGYGTASTYALNAPASIQNGSIVPHEQFLGVPLQKATLALDHRAIAGLSYSASLVHEGRYNELNRAPFTTFACALSQTFGSIEVGLAGTNLTNVDAARFTQAGAGVPYGGITGPIATDAYALPSRSVTFSITRRF